MKTEVATEVRVEDRRFRAHAGEVGLEEGLTLLGAGAVPASPRDSWRRRGLAAADLVSLAVALATTLVVSRSPYAFESGDLLLLGLLPFWILVNKALGLYDRDAVLIDKSSLDELPVIAQSALLGTAAVYLLAPTLTSEDLGRVGVVTFAATATLLMPTLRTVARTAVRRRFAPERCVIVGSGVVADMVARKIGAHGEYGAEVVGCVDDVALPSKAALPYLGPFEEFDAICETTGAERMVVTFSGGTHGQLLDLIRIATRRRMKISIVPRLFEVTGRGVAVDHLEGLTLMALRASTRTRSTLAIKRGMDIAIAGLGLLALTPVLLVIAAAIKLTSPGPVLFRQRRVGRDNEVFEMFKFRTMVHGADAMKPALQHLNDLRAAGPMFKISDDPRVTRFGRILRRTSLDELPQLWNVLRGEMSLVGPRPLVPDECAHLLGWHRARLELTPGLTGPWQVLGRTNIPFDEMVKLDYLYVADWSLWNDVKLVLRTLPIVVRRNGM